MVKGKFVLAAAVAAASFTLCAGTSRAVVYTEGPADAGQTLATAQSANTGGAALTGISGTIGTSGDADLYKFYITSTTLFSAAATGGASSIGGTIDTSLFLFNSTGVAIIANDDRSGTSYDPSIAAGSTLVTTLSPGIYYLGISLSGNEPVNLNSQLLFTADSPSTSVRGTASGLNPTTESTFNGQTYVAETGPYSITVTGAVPEPSTWAALGLSAAALAFVYRRRVA